MDTRTDTERALVNARERADAALLAKHRTRRELRAATQAFDDAQRAYSRALADIDDARRAHNLAYDGPAVPF